MEHRLSRRLPVSCYVLVSQKGHPLIFARARDISSEGFFIELDPSYLAGYRYLELRLYAPGDDGFGAYNIPALIMHRRTDGIGVMIDLSHPQAAEVLQLLMNSPAEVPHAPLRQPLSALSA